MQEKIIIEIPKETDFEEVNRLAKQAHELHVRLRPDLFISSDKVITEENFEKMIAERRIYVAKTNHLIIGYIVFKITEKDTKIMRYRKVLYIESICIDQNFRRKGTCTKLLKFVKNIAKENECTDLYLNVYEDNKSAIKCYEKFGFKVKSISYSMKI